MRPDFVKSPTPATKPRLLKPKAVNVLTVKTCKAHFMGDKYTRLHLISEKHQTSGILRGHGNKNLSQNTSTLSVNAFSTKLVEDTLIFTLPTKGAPLCVVIIREGLAVSAQGLRHLHFSVIFRFT